MCMVPQAGGSSQFGGGDGTFGASRSMGSRPASASPTGARDRTSAPRVGGGAGSSTILTSGSGVSEFSPTANKTLLGQ